MSPQFQHASFIPKRPLIQTPNQPSTVIRRRKKVNIFGIVSALIFGAGLLGAGGVFIYNQNLEKEILEKQQILDQETARIDESFVDTIKTVYAQITLADSVLLTHISPAEVFKVINEVTLKSAQLESVSFEGSRENGTFDLEVSGLVQSFESLARQADAYRADSRITSVEIEDVEVGEDSRVSYTAAISIAANIGRYITKFPPPVEATPEPEEASVPTDNVGNELGDIPGDEIVVPENAVVPGVDASLDTEVESLNEDIDFSDLDSLLDNL